MPLLVYPPPVGPLDRLGNRLFRLDGVPFGRGCPIVVESFDQGVAEWTTQDGENPVGDGEMHGRDTLRAPTWTWELATDQKNEVDALAQIDRLGTAWRNGAGRNVPGSFMTMRYTIAGRTRQVYGRPRRWAPDVNGAAVGQGNAKITADFKLVNPLHYDEVERALELGLIAPTGDGLVLPAVLPWILGARPGIREGIIEDTGTSAPTPIRAVIDGPASNPIVEGPGFRLQLMTTLAYDRSVTIDTRPWVNTVLRDDGVSLAGALTRTSRLQDARLRPGAAEIAFSATDPTNTARCRIYWRPASETL